MVCIEKQDGAPRRVWVRLRSKVRSFPLEKIRLATPDEMLGSQFVIQALDDVFKDIKEGKLVLEENKRCLHHLELNDEEPTWMTTSCWMTEKQSFVRDR